MKQEYPPWDRNTRRPHTPAPPKSCDSQVHIYDKDQIKHPLRPDTPYRPPDATFADVQKVHHTLGIERGVIVQSACYGTDHSLLLEALAKDKEHYRGCAVINDSVSDKDLLSLHESGIRGARFSFAKLLKASMTEDLFVRSVARIAELGWWAKVFVFAKDLIDNAKIFQRLEIPVIMDHMGGLDRSQGLEQEGMQLILDLLKRGNWWVMLSNGDRDSVTGYPWNDSLPFARAFIDAAPDRVIWGSDWPHSIYQGTTVPNDADLLELLYRFAPDPATRQKILVDNPARFFGFNSL